MIDLWIIDKFNILPTDDRFLDLYEEQKIALFEGVCSLPDQDRLKRTFVISKEVEKVKKLKDKEIVNEKVQNRFRNDWKREGISDDEIEQMIKNMINVKKRAKIEELEKLKDV